MSAKGSDTGAFQERDDAPTEMSFDTGGVPFYVAIVWVVFLVAYLIYMVRFALPDLSAWSELF